MQYLSIHMGIYAWIAAVFGLVATLSPSWAVTITYNQNFSFPDAPAISNFNPDPTAVRNDSLSVSLPTFDTSMGNLTGVSYALNSNWNLRNDFYGMDQAFLANAYVSGDGRVTTIMNISNLQGLISANQMTQNLVAGCSRSAFNSVFCGQTTTSSGSFNDSTNIGVSGNTGFLDIVSGNTLNFNLSKELQVATTSCDGNRDCQTDLARGFGDWDGTVSITYDFEPLQINDDPNTIAYYRFEEGSGQLLTDSTDGSTDGVSSAAHILSVPESEIPLTGDANQNSLNFDNVSEANFSTQPFIFSDAFGDATLEFWINPADQPHGSILWGLSDTDANRYNLSINPGGHIRMDYRDELGNLHGGLASMFVDVDDWAHVAITRTVLSATEHLYRSYLDGQLVYSFTDLNPNLPTADAGWSISGRSSFWLEGAIDELRFSDVALNPNQFLNARVPEPGALTLFFIGLAGLGFARRKCAV